MYMVLLLECAGCQARVGRRRFRDARWSRFRRGVIPGNGGAEERFRHANDGIRKVGLVIRSEMRAFPRW